MDKTNREIDPHHRRIQGAMRVFGPIVASLGLIFAAIGLISFFRSFGTFEPPRYFWGVIVGLPMIGIGLALTRLAYLGEYMRYFSAEVTPVATDVFNTMTEGTREGVETMAHALGRGFSTGMGATLPAGEPTIACSHCEAPNSAEARFCNQCGTALKNNTCTDCGAAIAPGSRFCNRCGKAIA